MLNQNNLILISLNLVQGREGGIRIQIPNCSCKSLVSDTLTQNNWHNYMCHQMIDDETIAIDTCATNADCTVYKQ